MDIHIQADIWGWLPAVFSQYKAFVSLSPSTEDLKIPTIKWTLNETYIRL